MSPRTVEQLAALKAARKEQIIKKSLPLFANKGYFNTSISDIAKNAKISKGLLYNYFENKEDLLNEVVIFALKEATESELTPEELSILPTDLILRKVVDDYFKMIKEKKELWRLTSSLAIQVSSIPSVHKIITALYTELTIQLEDVFEMMGQKDPKIEAIKLGALMDGIGIQYLIFGDEYPLEDIKDSIISSYIKNE